MAVTYKFSTQANDFEFGDEARFDASYQCRVWPRDLGGGVPAFLYAVLESNLTWRDRNKIEGDSDRDSGGTTWRLAPGFQYVTGRCIAEAAVQLPVVQDLNGDSLENDFVAAASVRMNF